MHRMEGNSIDDSKYEPTMDSSPDKGFQTWRP